MTTLSQVDPTAEIACTLPVNEAGGRLNALQTLIGDRLDHVSRRADRIQIRVWRAGRPNLEAELAAWAEAEKACCAFLGFAIEPEPDAVTLEIDAPAGAEPTLDGIEWIIRSAGGKSIA